MRAFAFTVYRKGKTISIQLNTCVNLMLASSGVDFHIEGPQPEWCISSMIYS